MKVYYIGKFHNQYATENYIALALEEHGVTVKRRATVDVGRHDVNSLINDINAFKPDVLLFGKYGFLFPIDMILSNTDALSVSWVFDLYFDLPPGIGDRTVHDQHFSCDVVITTDGGHDDAWKNMGIKHYCIRQGIHEPYNVMCCGEKEIDVLFLGSHNLEYRKPLSNFLKEKYDATFVGHPGDEVRGSALNSLIAKTKVIVGDSAPSPHYWSNRIYEVTGRAGFFLHPDVEGLNEEYTYYKQIIPYKRNNFEQLCEIIDFYISHDEEREEIAEAGFERSTEYTYFNRTKELLDVIKKEL